MKSKAPILLFFLLFSGFSDAISIGAGPSTITFGRLMKGDYSEQTITVSTTHHKNLSCIVEYTGEIADWLKIEAGDEFILPANSRMKLILSIQPPIDVENGKYEGAVYIKAAPTTEAGGGAALVVGAGVKIKISAEVTGIEEVNLLVKDVQILDTERGDLLTTSYKITNTGNVRVTPNFIIDVLDSKGSVYTSGVYNGSEILSMRTDEGRFEVEVGDLSEGDYGANLQIKSKDSVFYNKLHSFKVHPRGTYSVSGELDQFYIDRPIVSQGELVKVIGVFKNTGESKVMAKMVSEVYNGDILVEKLEESEEYAVFPGESVNLETYFSPKEANNYILRGYIVFANTKTDSKGTLVKMVTEGGRSNITYIMVIIVFMAAVMYMKFRSE